ncbi:MAG: hypothetical protein QQN41_08140 [Nitrosopumilus sp.]
MKQNQEKFKSSQEMINEWEKKQEISFFIEEFSRKYTLESTQQQLKRFNDHLSFYSTNFYTTIDYPSPLKTTYKYEKGFQSITRNK